MKAILEFDLEDFDDRMSHFRCIRSLDMALTLYEVLYNTRKDIEHKIEHNNITDPYEVLDAIMQKIWDDAQSHNVVIDELIN